MTTVARRPGRLRQAAATDSPDGAGVLAHRHSAPLLAGRGPGRGAIQWGDSERVTSPVSKGTVLAAVGLCVHCPHGKK